jgi:hypothetical protein
MRLVMMQEEAGNKKELGAEVVHYLPLALPSSTCLVL